MTESITIILPCAGDGSRLGLKTPKELFEILPGIRLIDFSLDHIRAFLERKNQPEHSPARVRAAVVIRPWKQEVADYVIGQMSGIPVETVFFDDRYADWPGSVFSAASYFSPANLVLLPDSCLSLNDEGLEGPPAVWDAQGRTLIERVLEGLRSYAAVFGAVSCSDPAVLRNMGAMRVSDGRVTAFQDKPEDHFERYNAVWGCYGFRADKGRDLYEFLIQSVRHQPAPLEAQSFAPCGATPLHSYRDLGTWDRIRRFRQDFQLVE